MRFSLSGLAIACVVSCSVLPATAQEKAAIALNTPVVSTAIPKARAAVSSVDSGTVKATPAVQVLKTRCLDTGLLRLGSACVFLVVEPMKLGDQVFAVGDLIYAHVETVQSVAGLVFMRTDRVTSAQTRQTTPLSMVATERPRQPGVGIPHLLDGWKLNWEQL